MLTGRKFRINDTILCVEARDGRRCALEIPKGSTIKILSGPRPDDKRMVDILWEERVLTMFYEDLQAKGEAVGENSAG